MRTVRAGVAWATGLLLLGVIAAAAGCAEEDPEQAAADQALCDAKDRLGEALKDFTRTERETRSDEMASARDELFDAMAEVAHASGDAAEAEGGDGENPVSQLSEDLQAIDDDASLEEIAQDMGTSGGTFLEGVKEFIQGRDC